MKLTLTFLTALLLAPLTAVIAAQDPSLVAYWTFDESSGDIARDVSGNGHDATLKNVEWVPLPHGHALRFGGKERVVLDGRGRI